MNSVDSGGVNADLAREVRLNNDCALSRTGNSAENSRAILKQDFIQGNPWVLG